MDTSGTVELRFGNYVARRLIGKGGMGEVYLAEHPVLGRRVAAKVLSEQLSRVKKQVARFQQEAVAACKIGHPAIVEVYDFGTLPDGRAYYTMEFLEGETLADYLRRKGRLTPREALAILEPVMEALQAAHEIGIVHRDLKPENIFLARSHGEPQVKILDFGIAKLLYDTDSPMMTATHTGAIMGTPLYMSPEQAEGQVRNIGPTTDVYSMGVVLYHLLAGEPPFMASSHLEVLVKHVQEPPPPIAGRIPDVSPELERVVMKALAKDRKDRYQSMADFLKDFRAAVFALPGRRPAEGRPQDLPPQPPPPSLTSPAPPPPTTPGPNWTGTSATAGTYGTAADSLPSATSPSPPGHAGQPPAPGTQQPATSVPPSVVVTGPPPPQPRGTVGPPGPGPSPQVPASAPPPGPPQMTTGGPPPPASQHAGRAASTWAVSQPPARRKFPVIPLVLGGVAVIAVAAIAVVLARRGKESQSRSEDSHARSSDSRKELSHEDLKLVEAMEKLEESGSPMEVFDDYQERLDQAVQKIQAATEAMARQDYDRALRFSHEAAATLPLPPYFQVHIRFACTAHNEKEARWAYRILKAVLGRKALRQEVALCKNAGVQLE